MSCPSCQVSGRRLPSFPSSGKPPVSYLSEQKDSLTSVLKKCNHTPPLEDNSELESFLLSHSNLVEEFVLKNISQDELEKLVIRKSKMKKSSTHAFADKSSLSKWKFCVHKDKRKLLDRLTKGILEQKNKNAVINELVKSISSAIQASRWTFFIVDENNKILNSYSERSDSKVVQRHLETAGTISTFVANTGELVYASEILGDERFPSGTGHDGTDLSVICHPIYSTNGKIYGVVEFIRDATDFAFGEDDLEIVCSYMTWGAIAINYAESASRVSAFSQVENFVKSTTQNLLENTVSLEECLTEIVKYGRCSTKSKHCVLFLIDPNNGHFYSHFSNFPLKDKLRCEATSALGMALANTKVVNVKEAYASPYFDRTHDQGCDFTTKTLLVAPINENNKLFGFMQLINKDVDCFGEQDESIIQLCASYCNLALALDESKKDVLRKSNEGNTVKEMLTYQIHTKPKDLDTFVDTEQLVLPDDFYRYSFDFYKSFDRFTSLFVFMAKDIFKKHNTEFDEQTLQRFTLTVKNSYRALPYHNWEHAFSVAQFMYILLQETNVHFTKNEVLAIFFACICHDLDHRGRNNAFYQNTGHALARLYASSIMENHHFYVTQLIFQQKGCDIFEFLSPDDKVEVLSILKDDIIATDLMLNFKNCAVLSQLTKSSSFEWSSHTDRRQASYIMMTVADLCSSCKSWEVHRHSSFKVFEEFHMQAEEEIGLGIKPLEMFTEKNNLPQNQIEFLNGIVMPCVDSLIPIIPSLNEAKINIKNSSLHWEEMFREELAKNTPSDSTEKIEELSTPGSTLQEISISFVKYNCGDETAL